MDTIDIMEDMNISAELVKHTEEMKKIIDIFFN